MPQGALNYGELAAVYDDYCAFDGDIPFFVSLVKRVSGPVLELMAGTGRVSVPLLARGTTLHCVDSSLAMLRRLKAKSRSLREQPTVICSDVCQLPLVASYTLAILPFQGLTELTSFKSRSDLFLAVARVLEPGGKFVCTTHNPAVRQRSLNGLWTQLGTFPHRSGGSVTVSVRGQLDSATDLVTGHQRLEIASSDGATAELVLDLRFALPSLGEVTSLANSAGLQIDAVYGDYSSSPFAADSSPVIVTICTQAA